MTPTPPTLPFAVPASRVAQAYGLARTSKPAPAAAASAPATGRVLATIGPRPLGGSLASKAAGLVAARVPGAAFAPPPPGITPGIPSGPDAATTASLPFYRHPTDRNAAAVAVDLGRRLDLEG